MNIHEQVIEIIERINGLEKLYEQINGYVMNNFNLFWSILIGVFGIVSFALYFIAKSFVSSGIDKGLEKFHSEADKLNCLIEAQQHEISKLKLRLEDASTINIYHVPLYENVQGHLDMYKIGSLVFISGNIDVVVGKRESFGHIAIGIVPEGYRPLFFVKKHLWNPDMDYNVGIGQDGRIILSPDDVNRPTVFNSMMFPIFLSFPSYSNYKQNDIDQMS